MVKPGTVPTRPTTRGWTPTMERRAADLDGRQVKCLTADAGHMWMPSYDRLPAAVRRRLSDSPFNICAACLAIEAHRLAARPTVAVYFKLIAAIEQKLR
jgi:hypothetical protein